MSERDLQRIDVLHKVMAGRMTTGIAAAKAQGAYKGGTKKIDREKVLALLAAGRKPAHVARDLNVSRMSIYRISLIMKQARRVAGNAAVVR